MPARTAGLTRGARGTKRSPPPLDSLAVARGAGGWQGRGGEERGSENPAYRVPPPENVGSISQGENKIGREGVLLVVPELELKREQGVILRRDARGHIATEVKVHTEVGGGEGSTGAAVPRLWKGKLSEELSPNSGTSALRGILGWKGSSGGVSHCATRARQTLEPPISPHSSPVTSLFYLGTISCLLGWAHGEGGTGGEGRNPDVGGSQAGLESEGAVAVELPGAGKVDLLRRKERSDVLGHEVLRERQVDFPGPLRRVHHRVQDLGID